jgi:hypothetical protein
MRRAVAAGLALVALAIAGWTVADHLRGHGAVASGVHRPTDRGGCTSRRVHALLGELAAANARVHTAISRSGSGGRRSVRVADLIGTWMTTVRRAAPCLRGAAVVRQNRAIGAVLAQIGG